MTNVLITGIAGHLGSRLAQYLMYNEPQMGIIGIDNLSCGYPENIPRGENCKFIQADIASEHLLNLLSGTKIDYVFHFAAYAAECLSPFIRRYNYMNNVVGSANIINLCITKGVRKLVFTSSMAVYGESNHRPPFTEDSACNPIDPYGIAKRTCELDIAVASAQHGLPYVIIRPHNVYGPFQSIWQEYRNVLGIWFSRKFQGQCIRIYGSGEQKRAFSYIDDILPCLSTAAFSDISGEIVNLGGTREVTLNKLADVFRSVVGGCDIEHTTPRREVKEAWCTFEKSKSLLGFSDTYQTALEDGVHKMYHWAKKAWETYPARRGSGKMTLEVDKGLYPFWK